MGIHYTLAADGISLVLVLLTGLAAVAGVLFSWNIEQRTNEFFAFFLALIGGVYGVFLSFDLFLLFVFYEIAIVPKYFLIAIWGSTRREYARHEARALLLRRLRHGAHRPHRRLRRLPAATPPRSSNSRSADLPAHFQMWAFPLVFVGFAHPRRHVALPHLGAHRPRRRAHRRLHAAGRRRHEARRLRMPARRHGALPARPGSRGASRFLGIGSWRDVFAVLAVIGIVYGALVALVQTDFKFVIGYSSVSHMGFVLLGLMTLNQIGLTGAVLQMFSHGVLAGLLFAIVGRIVYERTHTRAARANSDACTLSRRMPFAAAAFVIAGMASMGLPGFSGFVAELQVLVGTWRANPWWTATAGIGIVVGVAYTWRAHAESLLQRCSAHGR